MMKIQSVGPASFKLMDLANAGEAVKLINPTINPTFNPFIAFSIFISSFICLSTLIKHFVCQKYNYDLKG
jgi:hypothetical protein